MGSLLNRGTKNRPQWYAVYRELDGKWVRKHTKQPKKDAAREFLATAEKRVRDGLVGVPDADEHAARVRADRVRLARTVADLAARFLGEVDGCGGYADPGIKNLDNYRRDARSIVSARINPRIGGRPAATLTRRDVEALREDLRGSGLANASVTQTLAVLSKIYSWACDEGLVTGLNPVARVKRPKGAESDDFLSRAEVGLLLARAEEDSSASDAAWEARVRFPMVVTAVYTGMRKGELFGLRWRDLDLDRATLNVARSYNLAPKNGEARALSLHPELVPILRQWKDRCPPVAGGLVFPVEPGKVADKDTDKPKPASREPRPKLPLRMGFKNDELGIVGLFFRAGCHLPADGKPWHMLRHTWASHAVMAGINLYAVQKMGGWKTPAMVQRYAKLAPDYLAAETARMSFAQPVAAGVSDLAAERRKRATEHDG